MLFSFKEKELPPSFPLRAHNLQVILKSIRMSVWTKILTRFLKITTAPCSSHGVSKNPTKSSCLRYSHWKGYIGANVLRGTEVAAAPVIAMLQLQEEFTSALPDQSCCYRSISSKQSFPVYSISPISCLCTSPALYKWKGEAVGLHEEMKGDKPTFSSHFLSCT